MRKYNGFNLIELLIVISIVGILTVISVPVYSNLMLTEHRIEATGALSRLAMALERYYIENNSYEGVTLKQLHFPEVIAENSYQLSLQLQNDNYTVQATPLAYQANHDHCGVLALNSAGEKSSSGSAKLSECW